MVTDPVCGMELDPQHAYAQSVYGETMYYFCSEGCKQQFERAPAHYAEHPGSTPSQQVTVHGVQVTTHDTDIQTQGVDVTTAHPHAMTQGTDVIATPGAQSISRGSDVVEPVESSESTGNAE
ncbi:MAG TPA: YHS domain-containing protein [Ktedonobacterales bacterium]|jgi:Cu+-exporting ATPase|nr:YHS domain-containing protein [Ktedonobacterales bacterium]